MIQLHDTLLREKCPFVPQNPQRITMTVDQAGHQPPLAVSKVLFSKTLVDFRSTVAGGVFDCGIAIDEGQAQPFCKALADRRFACTH